MRNQSEFSNRFKRQNGAVAILLVIILLLILLPLGLVLVKGVGTSWRRGTKTRTAIQARYRVESALEIARSQMVTGPFPNAFTNGYSATFPVIIDGKSFQVTVTHVIVRNNN